MQYVNNDQFRLSSKLELLSNKIPVNLQPGSFNNGSY